MTSPKISSLIIATAVALSPAVALTFLAPGASAQTRGQFASVSVEIGGDAKTRLHDDPILHDQIRAAARTVCAAVAIHSPLLPRERADCVRTTVVDAERKLRGDRIVIASQ